MVELPPPYVEGLIARCAEARASEPSIRPLLVLYGNRQLDAEESLAEDIRFALAARAKAPGLAIDVGAGFGAVILALSLASPDPVVGIEIAEHRARYLQEELERLRLRHARAVCADAFGCELTAARFIFLNNPFFSEERERFLDKVTRECRPGTVIVATNLIVRALRARPAFREDLQPQTRYRLGLFRLV